MKHYGLIGKRLGHSWSADYFARKFAAEGIDADYRLIELNALWEGIPKDLDGYNVTIPYKHAIIPYLDSLDAVAAEIGAVNVVKGGVGYNTDWLGALVALMDSREDSNSSASVATSHSGSGDPNALHMSLRSSILAHVGDRKALILGQGGAAKAVRYALRVMGIESDMISAHGKIEANVSQYGLIVNATPLGMWPEVETYPDIDYSVLKPQQVLFDCVYNPKETEFMRRGKAQGCTVIGGLTMLQAQAEASWRIWNTSEKV